MKQKKTTRKSHPVLKKILVFVVVFMICSIVFAGIAYLFLGDYLFNGPEETKSGVISSEHESPVNIMLTVTDTGAETGKNVAAVYIIRLDFEKANVSILCLPAGMKLKSDDGDAAKTREDTLSGFIAYGGAAALKKAIETDLQIPIDKQLILTRSGAEAVIDQYGGIIYIVPESILIDAGDGTSAMLDTGRQSLTGRQALSLLTYRGWSGGAARQNTIQREVLTSFFNQYLTGYYMSFAEANYLFALKKGETDLSYVDFSVWQPYLKKMASKNSPAAGVELSGAFSGDDYFFSPEGRQKLQSQFSKAE